MTHWMGQSAQNLLLYAFVAGDEVLALEFRQCHQMHSQEPALMKIFILESISMSL